MRIPVWLKTIIAGTLVSAVGWSVKDRINIGERLATVEAYFRESTRRLDKIDRSNERIEQKIDELLEEKK